jgi:transcriptional regulator with XRE-family HTH domain
MVNIRALDPSASIAALFGSELRRYRTAAGLTQEELGDALIYTGSLVGQIETARRTPSLDFAERCDEVLGTGGALAGLWPFVNREAMVPSWFRGFVEMEAAAARIQTYVVQMVPGLLQTEGYARTLFEAYWSQDVDARVEARMERQKILRKSTPPLFWAIIDEAALRRPIGSKEVMAEQLKRLVEISSRRIVVQVLPYSAGAHACMDGEMTILSYSDSPDIVYFEGPGSAQLIEREDEVEQFRLRYDLVKTAALTPQASIELIQTILLEES